MKAHSAPSRLRTLSIGGATFDLFLTMNDDLKERNGTIELKVGGKIEVERVTEACGGGASNTSVALSRLGLSASFCGVVGSDQWGEKLLQNLRRENVNVDAATVVENETSSFSIVLSLPNGERTILYTAGVNEHLHDTTFDTSAMERADAVYLNHLCEHSRMIEDDIVEMIVANPDIHLTWNPGGCQIEAGMTAKDSSLLLKNTNLLLLNKEEACTFTGSGSVEESLQKLIKAGAKNICITDGKHGVIASDGTRTYRCPILKSVNVVDTTGAGDAFGAAATWALLTGQSLQTALISGTLNAASVVSMIGAQAGLLTAAQMKEKLSQRLLTVETL